MEHEREANRVMLLTPPGAAAIAVVRIAGPKVGSFLAAHFSKPVTQYRCAHGRLTDGQRVIDDPVVVLHDDRADINLHGGPWVVQECLDLARRAGFQIVESDGDLLDARSTLEREMLAALPDARTEQASRALLVQPQQWAEFLQKAPSLGKPDLQTRVRRILDDRSLWWMLHPPKVAIVGIPNVGKSTLANQLFGTQRSITADLPGTTRDWVGDWANIDGLPVHLLDTPGQRETSDPIESTAIARSRREIESADLVLLVLDPTQPLEPGQAALQARFPDAITVLNKADLPAIWHSPGCAGIPTVANVGEGIDLLRRRIRDHFNIASDTALPRFWTDRQRLILQRALDDPREMEKM